MPEPAEQLDDDPWPLRGGECEKHGWFNNFSGVCWSCRAEGEAHA